MDAHVGAGFDDQAVGGLGVGEELEEGIDLELAALAVMEEGLAHEEVIAIDEHGAVAGGHELVVGADGDALHGNLRGARLGPVHEGNCWKAVRPARCGDLFAGDSQLGRLTRERQME